MNSFVIIKILSSLISSYSQILLKRSSNRTYDNKIKEYLNYLVIVGYGLMFISLAMSVYSLKGISLSFSALLESFDYILVPLMSYLLLKTRLTKRQILGTIIIVVGAIVFNIN